MDSIKGYALKELQDPMFEDKLEKSMKQRVQIDVELELKSITNELMKKMVGNILMYGAYIDKENDLCFENGDMYINFITEFGKEVFIAYCNIVGIKLDSSVIKVGIGTWHKFYDVYNDGYCYAVSLIDITEEINMLTKLYQHLMYHCKDTTKVFYKGEEK